MSWIEDKAATISCASASRAAAGGGLCNEASIPVDWRRTGRRWVNRASVAPVEGPSRRAPSPSRSTHRPFRFVSGVL